HEGDDRRDERGERRGRRDVARRAPRDPHAGGGDRERGGERQREADPGGRIHPRSVLSLSTSSSTCRRPIATIRPRPTTNSDAATAITAIANTWPSSCPSRREKAIRARFAPLSMISTESRMISGLRRTSTPSAPVTNSTPARTRYQPTSGPCIFFQRAGVSAQHDAADRGDEQHDRGHLEREQMVGEEEPSDRRRRSERPIDVRLLRQVAGRERERDDHLGED